MTKVKNQGQCGSCWAFDTTEMIESYAAIATGNLVELSAQQVAIKICSKMKKVKEIIIFFYIKTKLDILCDKLPYLIN